MSTWERMAMSLRHREVAQQGALDHRLVRQEGLQLAPERDAFGGACRTR